MFANPEDDASYGCNTADEDECLTELVLHDVLFDLNECLENLNHIWVLDFFCRCKGTTVKSVFMLTERYLYVIFTLRIEVFDKNVMRKVEKGVFLMEYTRLFCTFAKFLVVCHEETYYKYQCHCGIGFDGRHIHTIGLAV